MNKKLTHTPTPWHLLDLNPYIFDEREEAVALFEMRGRSPAQNAENAAFIVKAVNAHEELLAIVKVIYADENDITRRKHSDELRFRMEEIIDQVEREAV